MKSAAARILRRPGVLVTALVLALSLLALSALPASAQSLAEYFNISFDPVTFDKSEITGDEVFHATVAGRAVCAADLPMSPSEATITSKVIAVHSQSGAVVTLNPSYTVKIKPFPSKQDETFEISQDVPLQFPPEAASGEYDVFGEIIEAKAKVMFAPIDVTAFLPDEQTMGTVIYTTPEGAGPPPPAESSPEPEPVPKQEPETTPSKPAPAPTATPSTEPERPGPGAPWWVWPVVVLAGATTVFNVVWFLYHRR